MIILSFVAATRIHFLPREAGLLSLINQVFRGAFVGFFPWAGWLERGGEASFFSPPPSTDGLGSSALLVKFTETLLI